MTALHRRLAPLTPRETPRSARTTSKTRCASMPRTRARDATRASTTNGVRMAFDSN
jgi:hypothetical protein